MKRRISNLLVSLVLFPCAVTAQGAAPFWLDSDVRNLQYPADSYYTGFSEVSVAAGEGQEKAVNRAKQAAVGELSERVRVMVLSEKKSADVSISSSDAEEQIRSKFESAVRTASQTEVVGSKVNTWYDAARKTAYAFAYANKYELTGYYKANIGMFLQQAEGNLNTAEQLEQGNEKAKARRQCEAAIPLLAKVRYAQDLLTAIDASDGESLQQAKAEDLRSKAIRMLARLAQGVYVYVESSEDNFGKREKIIANRLKALLATKGCSFTDDAANADLRLKMVATTRKISKSNNIVFCYADVEIELYDNRKQKVVFNDELSQKGGSSTNERAGRKALEDAVPVISEKISPWIE